MARGLLCHPSSPGSGAPRTLRGQRGDAVGYFAGIGAGPEGVAVTDDAKHLLLTRCGHGPCSVARRSSPWRRDPSR